MSVVKDRWMRNAMVAIVALGLAGTLARPAHAQDDGPNTGNISFSSGIDFLPGSTYYFRGIRQEADPKLTVWPWGDVGLSLYSGDGGLQSFDVNFGVWHSLHSGSSGSGTDGQRSHYEEDFYAGFSMGFSGNTSLGVTYTAYTSPNGSFSTVHEVSFTVAVDTMYAPYVTYAQETNGDNVSYLELGVGPGWDLAEGKVSVAVPVAIGLGMKDKYYFGDTFGFFTAGVGITVPLSGVSASFGSWDFHANVDFLAFGDGLKEANGEDGAVTGALGFSFSY